MALRQVRIGSLVDIHQYDDGDYDKSIEVEDPIKCTAAPVGGSDVVRLEDLGVLYPVSVADLDNPTELALVAGTNGMLVLAYKVIGPAVLNEYTLYTYDSSGPAVSNPYVVDAAGVGNERWIAIAGKYRIFTTMYTLGTKNPPIDADKVIYRDSAAADVLVTSTWTQIKAFLKTYFDGLYGALGTAHNRLHAISSTSDHSDVNLTGISNNDLMQWDDPSSKWEPKSVAEVISGQSIAPGPVTISDVEDWRYAASIADDGTKALPTIKADYAAIGNIVISSSGVINESAEFEIDSTGTCQIIRGTANVVVNADIDTKVCLGTAAAQNPLTIKNRLGGVRNIMITIMYVKA